MDSLGGAATAERGVNPQLGAQIVRSERRRTVSWRAQFLVMWLVILTALVTFVAATVRLDTVFLNRVVPFILAGVTTTLFVSFASIALAIVFATLGALGRLSSNPYLNAAASF
jgi:ABC-type amino acid transport system permease subunit